MKPAVCLGQFLLNSYPSTLAPTLCGAAGQGVLLEVLSSLCCHLVYAFAMCIGVQAI